MRARMEGEIRAIVQELVSSAAEERQAAVANARDAAVADTRRELENEVAQAQARAQATLDQRLSDARAEREQATLELRDRLTAESEGRLQTVLDEADARAQSAAGETERRLAEAAADGDARVRAAVDEAEERAAQALAESVAAARVGEREYEMAGLARLLDAVRGLDGAASLSDVLDVLGQAAGRETCRAALLVLRGDRVQGWKVVGFGALDSQPRSVDLALIDAGIVGAAISGTRVVTTPTDHDGRGPGFAALPADRIGMAVPVLVGGRAVAVLYADTAAGADREVPVPSGWPEVIEILARHAGRCLEALTAQRTSQTPSSKGSGAATAKTAPSDPQTPDTASAPRTMSTVEPEVSARRLARLLISEIKLYHEAAVHEARKSRTLLARLGPEIDRARRAYDTRIPASLASRADLFHQELIATLAGGDPSLLGVPA
ncbi:MAG: hypothetical protein ABR606_10485 [Vicinamibacterales bacterium]